MKKIIATIIIFAMLCSATPILAIDDDGNQAYHIDESQTDVTTLATIDGQQGSELNPIIKAKWEYDMDVIITDYNPYDPPECFYHDAEPSVPHLQVKPIIGETVTVGYFAVVTSPIGINPDPDKLGYISTYADIWHPDGQFKYQIELYPVGWNGETYSKTQALNAWNHVINCHEDLIKINDNWANTLPPGITWEEDIYDELNEEIALLYYTTAEISYCQPGGYYSVGNTAFDQLGYQAEYLYDQFWYIPTSAVEIDFTQVDYSPVHVGIDKTVGGDYDMTTPNKPTVRNIGNTPVKLNIWQDDMCFGMTSNNWNVQFDARLGPPGENDKVVYYPYQNTNGYPGIWIPGILPLCTEDKLDFSIKVHKGSSGYTYNGLMRLYAYIDMDSYIWNTPAQYVNQPPQGVPDYNLTQPIASFSYHPQNPKTIDTIQFTDTSTDKCGIILSWSWNFGDGTTSTLRNPTHKYDDDGIYKVTLNITDDYEEESTKSEFITVTSENIPPIAEFTYSPQNPTTDDTVVFTDSSTDTDGVIVSWSWNFGDGTTSTLQNPTHKFSLAGEYTITLLVTDDDSETDTEQKMITITENNPSPPDNPPSSEPSGSTSQSTKESNLKADANGPYNGFVNTPIVFDGSASTNPDGNITTYAWNFGDGTNATGKTTAYTYNKTGNFTVTLTVFDDHGNSDTDTTYSNIIEGSNEPPTANFNYSPPNPTTEDTIQFNDSSIDNDGTIVSWHWNFSDGTSSEEENPNHKYDKDGTYNITLKVTDDEGASDEITKTIPVHNTNNIEITSTNLGNQRGLFETYGFYLIIIVILVAAVLFLIGMVNRRKNRGTSISRK